MDGHTQGLGRRRQSRGHGGVVWIVGIEDGSDAPDARHRDLEKIQPLADQRVVAGTPRSGDISAGLCDALCKPRYDRVLGRDHNDRDRPRCVVGSQGAGLRAGDNCVRIERDQLAGKRGHALRHSIAIAKHERHVAPFHIAEIAQTRSKRRNVARRRRGRDRRQDADHRPDRRFCAPAVSGHVAAAPPSSVMNSRRFTRSPRRRGQAASPAHRARGSSRS